MSARILIVDDELVVCKSCEKILTRAGHDVAYRTSGKEALDLLRSQTFDVIFTDLKMADVGGMEIVESVRNHYPETVVVVITGYATVASAVETMRSGAFDYLPKPFTPSEMVTVLDRALERRRLIDRSQGRHPSSEQLFEGFIGGSAPMQGVYQLIQKVAPTDATVLIIGESGTGKDLAAKAIHNRSKRSSEKFFAIDLTTLSSALLESELFGHVRGSFTGASADHEGVFEVADGGTIFLDEIGNLPLETQARLLRVLQEREVLPVGSTSVRKVDVRMILATNKDLKELVDQGRFREDLYYRLHVFPIKLPPLRERKEDIPDLVRHFLLKYWPNARKSPPAISTEALNIMMSHEWPGNIRELEHAVERLAIVVEGNSIEPSHVAAALFRTGVNEFAAVPSSGLELKALKKRIRASAVHDIEKTFVEESLSRNDWNISRAARDVKMQRSNFQSLMKKYNIRKPPSA